MEINITRFVIDTDTWDFSGSVATHGANAGRDTWRAALVQAKGEPRLWLLKRRKPKGVRPMAKTRNPWAYNSHPVSDSPTETCRKGLPRGDGNWPGFDYVYGQIMKAAHAMALQKDVYLSEEHINTMAVAGCGHEETMKGEMWRLRGRGFIK